MPAAPLVRRTGSALITSHPPFFNPYSPPGAPRKFGSLESLRVPEKIHMFSIVISFGVATLFATGLLLLVQIVDDLRNS